MKSRISTSIFAITGLLALLAAASPAFAQDGGVVTQGGATITNPTPTVTQINQVTEKTVIQWNDFSIAAGSAAIFNQPSATSIALNQVTGVSPSSILGSLQANGQVWILNPNGILFGQNATINVGALMASTLSLSENDFMSGNYHLLQDPSKAASYVVNQGSVTATSFAALIAPLVENSGSITSNGGQVYLLGTGEAILDINGAGLVGYSIGSVTGQTVHIREDAVSDVVRAVVNSGGLVEAGSIIEDGSGVVRLVGAGGLAVNTGTISVSGSTGVSGGQVVINSTNASINAWGSTINASGHGLNSDGGSIVVISQDDTYFRGTLTATGGTTGDGGFVEVSAAHNLWYRGTVNVAPTNGASGTLLIDPATITITNAAGSFDLDFVVTGTPAGEILAADADSAPNTLSVAAIEAITAGTAISIAAVDSITFEDVTDGDIDVDADSITFITTSATTSGDITFADATNTITSDGAITFVAAGDLSVCILNTAAGDDAITLTAGGNITFGALDAGAGLIDMNSGGLIDQTGGTITAGTLDLSAVTGITDIDSDVDELIATNSTSGDIEVINGVALSLNGVTNGGDDILITNTGSITIDAALSAAGSLIDLSSTGSITQTAGTVTAADLELTAVGGIGLGTTTIDTLVAANTGGGALSVVDSAGGLQVLVGNVTNDNADITITTTGNLLLTGDLDAGTGDLFLTATGGTITQSITSDVSGDQLTYSAGGLVELGIGLFPSLEIASLTGTSTGILNIDDNSGGLSLGDITNTGGTVTIETVGTLAVTGTVTSGTNAMTLTSEDTDFNQTGGSLTAGTLTITADTGATILAATASGVTTITTNGGDLVITGSLSSGTAAMTLTATAGQIDQTGGTVTAGALTAVAGDGIDLISTDLTSLTANSTGLGDVLSVNDVGTLTVSSATSNDGAINLVSNGTLQITGTVNAGAANVLLDSTTGAVNQSSGTITAVQLTANAEDGITLGQAPAVLNITTLIADNSGAGVTGAITVDDNGGLALGAVTNAGGLIDIGAGGNINQNGAVTAAGAVTLTTTGGSIDINAALSSGTNGMTLSALAGAVTWTSGVVTAGALTIDADDGIEIGSAATRAVFSTLDADNNDTGTIDIFETDGFSVIAATTNNTNITLDSATGAVTQAAGSTISGNQLTVNAEDGISLGQGTAVLSVTTLVADNSGPGVTGAILVDQVGALSLGVINNAGGAIDIGTGAGANLTQAQNISAPGNTVTLNTGGNFVRTGGTVSGASLTLVADEVTGTLTTAVTAAAGNLSVNLSNAGTTLTISQTAANLVIFGVGLNVPTGTINISSANQVGQAAGSAVNAAILNVTTATGGIAFISTAVDTFSATNNVSGNISIIDAGTLSVTGVSGTAGTISITAGTNLSIDGNVNSGGNLTTLISTAGNIAQTTGTITAGALTLTATTGSIAQTGVATINVTGLLTFASEDGIALGDLDTPGVLDIGSVTGTNTGTLNISIDDASGGLGVAAVANNVVGVGNVTIRTGGTMSVTGNVTASEAGDTVTLTATGGSINQSAGTITSGTATLTATGAGSFSMTGGSINIGGTLTLSAAGGSISQSGATASSITAGTLVFSSSTGVTLGSPGTPAGTLTIGTVTGTNTTSGNIVLNDSAGGLIVGAAGITSTTAAVSNLVLTTATGNLTLTGTIDGGANDITTLTTTGGSISSGGGTIIGQRANLSATAGITFNGPDLAVGIIQATNTGGGTIDLDFTGNVTVDGTGILNVGGTTILSTPNALNQNTGSISAGTLQIQANVINGSLTTALGNLQVAVATGALDVNNTGALTVSGTGITGTTGTVDLSTSGTLTINANINAAGQTLILTSTGANITRSNGTVTANLLQTSSVTGTTILAGLTTANLSATNTGAGDVDITNAATLSVDVLQVANGSSDIVTTAGNLTVDASVNVSGTLLLDPTGTLDQTAGTITAGTLQVAATSVVGNTLDTAVANLQVTLTNATLVVNNTGNLQVAGSGINIGTGDLTLDTVGNITQAGGSAIVANDLVLDATTGITLTSVAVDTLTAANATSNNISVTDAGALAITLVDNNAAGGNVTIVSGGAMTLNGNVDTAGTATLTAGGILGQAGGTINAGSAALTSVGGMTFTGPDLNVGNIAATNSGGGNITLDFASPVDVETIGAINGIFNTTGNVSLVALGNLNVNADVNNTGFTTVLNANGGNLDQNAGTITANTLNAIATGSVTLISVVANTVNITSGADIILNFNSTSETVFFALNSGANIVVTNTGNLVFTNDITATLDVTLTSFDGSIAYTTAGAIVTAGSDLIVDALNGITINEAMTPNLTATNALGAGGTGAINITNGQTLSVDSAVNENGGIAIQTTSGDLTIDGSVTSASFLILVSEFGLVDQNAGTITATNLLVDSFNGINLPVTDVDNFQARNSNSGDILITNTGDLELADLGGPFAGAINSSGGVLISTTGNLVLNQDVNATGFATSLTAGGTITSTGGTISAAALTLVAVGDLTLPVLNVGAVNATNTNGDMVLADLGGMIITGISNTGGTVDITSTNAILITGNVTNTGNPVTITTTVAGGIAQTGGTISSSTLTMDAVTGIALTSVNATGAASFTAGTGGIAIGGNVSSGTNAMTMTAAAGAVTWTAGAVTAGTLTIDTAGGIALGSAAVRSTIGTLDAVNTGAGDISIFETDGFTVAAATTAPGNITLNSSGPLALAGSVDTGTAGNVTLAGSTITQNSGTILGDVLTLNSTGNVSLGQAGTLTVDFLTGAVGGSLLLDNSIALEINALTIGTTGDIESNGTLTQDGNITSGGALSLDANTFAFDRQTGLIDATALTLVANNVIGTLNTDLGNLSVDLATGNLTITNAGALVVFGVGLDVPGGTVTITSSGTVGQTAGSVNATSLAVTAVGGITLGTVAVDTLAATNSGGGAISVTDTNAGLTVNTVGAVVGVSNAGNVTISTPGVLTLTQNVSATGGLATLVSTNTSIGGAATVNATSLALDAETGIVLSALNVTNLSATNGTSGAITLTTAGAVDLESTTTAVAISNPGRDVSITSAGVMTVVDSVTGGTVNLTATGAAFTSGAGGTISSGQLTISAGNGISIGGAIAATGTVTATTNAAGAITVAAAVNSGANAQSYSSTSATGAFSHTAGTITSGTLSITSGGAVTLGSTITASGNVTVSGNSIGVAGSISAPAANTIAFTTTAGTFTHTAGLVSAGTLTINASGSITFSSIINTSVNLSATSSTGNISITAAGAINGGAGTMTLDSTTGLIDHSAGTLSVTGLLTANADDGITLGGGAVSTLNIATLVADNSSAGTVTVADDSLGLTINSITAVGAVNVSTVGGALTVAGNVNAGAANAVTLAATGAGSLILQTSGTITSAALTLNTAGNITLTSVAANGLVSATSTAGDILINGPVSAGAANDINLSATGAGGDIGGAGLLTGQDLVLAAAAGINLTNTVIDTVAGTNTAGAFTVTDTLGALATAGAGVSSGGNVTLSTPGNLTLTTTVTSGATASLTSLNGTIVQGAATPVNAPTFVFNTQNALTLTGLVIANVNGTVEGPGAVDLTTTAALTVVAPGIITNAGNIVLATGGNLTVSGNVNAGVNAVDLDATGSILQTAVGANVITGQSLILVADSGITVISTASAAAVTNLEATNSTSGNISVTGMAGDVEVDLGGVTNMAGAGNVTIVATGNLTLVSNVTVAAGTNVVSLQGATISQAGGTIVGANRLVLVATTNIDLVGMTAVELAARSTSSGTISLDFTGSVTVVNAGGLNAGLVNPGGDVLVTVGSDFTQNGTVDVSGGSITLDVAAGAITWISGAFNAGTALLATFNGIVLNGGTIDNLEAVNDPAGAGDIAITSLTGDLSITVVDNQAGNVVLSTNGAMTLNGDIIALTLADLTADNFVAVGGAVNATDLIANATNGGSIDTQAINVEASNNASTLTITSSTALPLVIVGNGLTGAGDITLVSPDNIEISSDIDLGGTATLIAGGDIVDAGGAIIANSLVLDAGNSIDPLFTTITNLQVDRGTGDLVIDNTGDLTVFGTGIDDEVGIIDLTTDSNLFVDAPIFGGAANDVFLTANGGDVSGAGQVTANTLTVSATGSINLTNVSFNAFSFTAGTDITIVSNNPAGISIVAPGIIVGAGSISVTTTGPLIIDADVTAPVNVTLSSTNDVVVQINGLISAGGLLTSSAQGGISMGNVEAASFNGSNTVNAGDIFVFDNSGGLALTGVTNTVGLIDIATTGGTLAVNGVINGTGQSVTLTANGGNINGAFAVQANLLTVNADTGIALSLVQATSLAAVNDFTTPGTSTGTVQISDQGGLTVNGISNPGGTILLNTTGLLTLQGGVNATTNQVTLNAIGNGLTQSAGSITSGILTMSANGAITVTNVAASGNVLITTSSGNLAINGPVSAGAANDVTLTASAGAITSAGGSVTANDLVITASTGATVGAATIDTLNVTTASGAVSVTDTAGGLSVTRVSTAANGSIGAITLITTGDLTLAGPINSGANTMTLTATGGVISHTTGTVTAGTLTATAANGITLGGGATTLNLTALIATNSANAVSITETGGISSAVVNNLNGNVTILTTGSLLGGSITGQLLTLTTTGGATLTGHNITSLTVTNNSSGNVILTGGTNSFTVTGTGIVTPGTTTLAGTGTITISANIGSLNQALSLTSTAGSVVRTSGTLNIGVGTLSVTTATGGTLGSVATGAITITNFNANQTGAGVLSVFTTGAVTILNSGLNGITSAAGGTVQLTTTTGVITINAQLVGAGAVSLISGGGNVVRGATTHAITVNTLFVQGTTSITLTHTATTFILTPANLGGVVTTAGQTLAFTVGGSVGITGMQTNNGSITVNTNVAGLTVTINGTVSSGSGLITIGTTTSGNIVIASNVNITGLSTVTIGSLSITSTITQQAGTGVISTPGTLQFQSLNGQTIIGFSCSLLRITNSTSGAVSVTGGLSSFSFSTTVTAANGPLTISTAGSITINQTITNTNQTTTLIAGAGTGFGSINRTAGIINCATLNLVADQGINLPSGSLTTVTNLSAVNNDAIFGFTSGAITITSTNAATLNIVGSGLVNTGGNISLTTSGPIALNAAGVTNFPFTTTLTAGGAINGTATIDTFQLNLTSAGGQSLTNLFFVERLQSTNTGSGATTLTNLGTLEIVGTGVSNTVGGVTIIANFGNLIISANVTNTAQTTAFDAFQGELRQTAGLIQSGNLQAFADFGITLTNLGSMTLQATNFTAGPIHITSGGSLTVTSINSFDVGGDISVFAAGALTATGAVSTVNGFIHMQSGGDLTATGTFTATTDVRMSSGGALNMGTTGVINAPALVDLDGVNVTLNDITTGGPVTVDATGTLSMGSAGLISTPTMVDLQAAGAVTIGGDITAGGAITLATAGTLTISNGSVLNSAASVVLGSGQDMTLSGAIATPGAFTANSVGGLSQTLTGAISAQSAALHSLGGVLSLGGSATISGNFEGYGLTGVTQGTTGSISAMNVTLNTPGAVALNLISGSGAVDVQAGANASITQSTTSIVTGAVSVNFQAGQSVFLGGVGGGSILIIAVNGTIADNNDAVTPNSLNLNSAGDITLVASGSIGSIANPIEVQGGIVTVHTNGVPPPAEISLTGTTADGIIHIGSAPAGTIIFFNENLLAGGGNVDRVMNWYRDLLARGYDVWSQVVLTDDDTAQHKVIMRARPAPRRATRTPLR